MDGSVMVYRLGATVGLVGGTVFVLANRGVLGRPWPLVSLALWVLLLAAALWGVWLRTPRPPQDARPPARHAGLIYLLACAGMILLVFLGRLALDGAGHVTGVPALVAAAVGLHFLPFAHAFRASFFTTLGWALTAIGVAGLVAEFVLGPPSGSAAAVAAGLVMTGLIAWGAHRNAKETP